MADEYYILNDALHRVRKQKDGTEISEILEGEKWLEKSKPDLIRHFGRMVDPASIPGFAPQLSGPSPLPRELRGFNWGAFFLNWAWGLFNRTPIALLTFVPIIGIFMPFVLGIKGNAWAWRNKRWESVEQFKTVQRRWAFAGLIIWLLSFAVAAGAINSAMNFFSEGDPFTKIMDALSADPRVHDALGDPLEPSFWVNSSLSIDDDAGRASMTFMVSGPEGDGTVYAESVKRFDTWEIESLSVRITETDILIPIIGDPKARKTPAPATPPAKTLGSDQIV